MSEVITEQQQQQQHKEEGEKKEEDKRRQFGNGRRVVKASSRFEPVRPIGSVLAKHFTTGKNVGKEIHRKRSTVVKWDENRCRKAATGITVRRPRVKTDIKKTLREDTDYRTALTAQYGHCDFTYKKEAVDTHCGYMDHISERAKNAIAEMITNPTSGEKKRVRLRHVHQAFSQYCL
jgi:hypothetical protein